ncbi:predicted protein [Sclerotinia sclerotiorum 1980 UF-70]|uniref:Uncharacterized protein n=1 Tax=Sclerotinia sclerotiorum (strain ATCC 18683 / 1980 / Ss-1) TaxID=665079 RepID=A7F0N9_SCLS1|nr:predicted protein [Sclerotinia sclerotiorum 1980 UF-70]EDN95281.1 predicted protein [Sclerotinia sclerotiorum 1980 UF-70]
MAKSQDHSPNVGPLHLHLHLHLGVRFIGLISMHISARREQSSAPIKLMTGTIFRSPGPRVYHNANACNTPSCREELLNTTYTRINTAAITNPTLEM